MNIILNKAREYEMNHEGAIKLQKPDFHLASRVGWMNDPNGFSVYNNEYHMFYQYHPYSASWGPMHWGHAKSKDLINWEYLPTALAPDQEYDQFGCFSGSAVTLDDGKHLLMYTGVKKVKLPNGEETDIQTQCIAIGDGVNYKKHPNNPVITADMLPEGCSKVDFRDPKIWRKEDGSYLCVVGNRPADGSGQVVLFSSKNAIDWKYEDILSYNGNRLGKMWECPDFFELNEKGVLLISPQDVLPQGYEYGGGNVTACLIGDFDNENNIFKEEINHAIDYGLDFYAPQSVLTESQRRIMVGWMANWDTNGLQNPGREWFGQMSIPRELHVINNRLIQNPVKEIENYRKNKVEYQEVTFKGNKTFEAVKGRRIDLEVIVKPSINCDEFSIKLAQDEVCYTAIKYDVKKSLLTMDRKFSGCRRAVLNEKSAIVPLKDGLLKLRLILDKQSIETFINDGEKAMTMLIFTDLNAEGISFFSDEEITLNLVKYDLVK